jgi:hypothetical protein
MQIAKMFGILVPNNGLISSRTEPAYIVERFDRRSDGSKLRQRTSAAAACRRAQVRGDLRRLRSIIIRFSARARADLVRLFERVVFAYRVGDGDMHLKNLSLLAGPDGRHSLSPAYDIAWRSQGVLSTTLPSRRRTRVRPRRVAPVAEVRGAANRGGVDPAGPADKLAAACDLVERSYLPAMPLGLRVDYLNCLRARADMLVNG